MLRQGVHRGITVEHVLVVDGDGEAHVILPDKYKSIYEEHPVEHFDTVEAALDFMHDHTNTIAPRWPLAYIPKQARFLRALCEDPEDACFRSIGLHKGENITLSAAVDLFRESELRLEDEAVAADFEEAVLSPLQRLKRLLDTPVGELFNETSRANAANRAEAAERARVDASARRAADRAQSRDVSALRDGERQVEADDVDRRVAAIAAVRGQAPAVRPHTARSGYGRTHRRVKDSHEEAYEVFEWEQPHRL